MKRLAGMLAGIALVTMVAGQASAIPTMRLTSGATTITILDNSILDLSSLPGTVVYSGAIGSFFVNVDTGITKPTIGGAMQPELDLNWVVVSGGAGSLTIEFSETDFLLDAPLPLSVTAGAGGTLGGVGTLTYMTYLDDPNALFGTGSLLTTQNFSSLAYSGVKYASTNATQPYSLTQVMTITHGSGITNSSGDLTLKVPEPGSLLLLGSGLLGVGIWGRRRFRK
jgi:hypothetical protein